MENRNEHIYKYLRLLNLLTNIFKTPLTSRIGKMNLRILIIKKSDRVIKYTSSNRLTGALKLITQMHTLEIKEINLYLLK